ncbi:MAG: DUF5666 domain-containing protein [Terracidiphilus sp.]|nr:DUF5666 domain-containing protein [Terracidiphilus sp.]
MKSNKLESKRFAQMLVALGVFLLCGSLLVAQTPVTRYVGTITALNGDMLTVKTDAGDVRQVEVPTSAVLKRVEPGQKDLNAAVNINLIDLATGDRVLVRLDPAANPPQAVQVITIKQADVALKQQQEREAWQKTGVGGLVKSIDPASGTIIVASGAGSMARSITVHVTSATLIKRYAPASVRFDLAQPAPISAIQIGDQLRARGAKSPDGSSIDAAEVVSGSFRNLSGTIASLDSTNTSFVIKDLASKKQITVHITPDAQMHMLSQTMATALAARLKTASGGHNGDSAAHNGAPASAGGSPFSAQMHAAGGYSDVQQLLNRAPVIQFADLKKGVAVMVVATAGVTDTTAISLLVGVEPLLEAPEASSNLLSNWSMGSGGSDSSAQ